MGDSSSMYHMPSDYANASDQYHAEYYDEQSYRADMYEAPDPPANDDVESSQQEPEQHDPPSQQELEEAIDVVVAAEPVAAG